MSDIYTGPRGVPLGAEPPPIIRSFTGPNEYLSNTYPCMVVGPEDGVIFPSAEHAFQAAKSENLTVRMEIAGLSTWRQAKNAGRALDLRPDWEQVKKEIMFSVVLAKFKQNPGCLERLLGTGSALLIEGNAHGDDYWGMILNDGIWQGDNYLGQILMAVRMVLS